jgi:hypothetical protein
MKILTEADYLKLSKEDQDKHHEKIREDLIKQGKIKPKT